MEHRNVDRLVRKVGSWAEFTEAVLRIDKIYSDLRAENPGAYIQRPLWRGQSNAEWQLVTTLQRFAPNVRSLASYYWAAYAAKPQIESFTGRRWDIQDPQGYAQWATNYDSRGQEFSSYEYLAYLRHFGFPSPLLDWSLSPYIAAWFALAESEQHDAAVFTYFESKGVKVHSSNEAQIQVRGPYVRADKRHFLQQCQYTVCLRFENAAWHYADHQEVIAKGNTDQDVLMKFVLSGSMRRMALQELDRFNINAYSLFGSEEALMKTMANRELLSSQ